MRAALVCLLALALIPAAAAHGTGLIDAAAAALEDDSVFVHPEAIPAIEPSEADELRDAINDAGGDVYVAILPADALHEAKTADAVLGQLRRRLLTEGTYAVVVGGQFTVTSSQDDLGDARSRALAKESFGEQGLAPTLVAFVGRVGDARGPRESGSGRSLTTIAVPGGALAALLALAFVLSRRRRRAG